MAAGTRARILVVEDDKGFCDQLKQFFEPRYALETVKHAAPVLERILGNLVDIVILDTDMPAVSGLQTLRLIKDMRPTLPVILLSENSQYAVAGSSMTDGAFAYVPKPCNLHYLDHLISAALSSKR